MKEREEALGHRKLKIYSWNINGINSTIDKKMWQSFLKDADPDIICLQEAKASYEKITSKKVQMTIPKEYEQHWNWNKKK